MTGSPPGDGIVFDARSAGMSRMTGWERYTTELANRLDGEPGVEVRRTRIRGPVHRLLTDLQATSLDTRDRLIHYPTFPPLRRSQGFVLTVHDLTFWKYPDSVSRLGRLYYRPLLERAIPFARHVVTHSRAVADEVVEHFGLAPERVTPVYCGADALDRVRPSGERRDRPYLLCVGTIEPRKNLGRLVEAYQASGLAPDVDLLLVGRIGWGARPAGVEILTDVSDARLKRLYLEATGVVCPSLYEGFGLPVAEAVNYAPAVACSDLRVFREVAGTDATYFDPEDVGSIREALRTLVAGGGVRDPARSRSSFTWDAVASNLVAVYGRLASLERG